jgi:putative transposase
MPRKRKPPSQTWRTFLDNHVKDLVSIDFFVVPTATFRVLFVLVILAHDRRRVMHYNVTEHPTAYWTGEQIIRAFPGGSEPRYLLRDRDSIYGQEFRERIRAIGIEEILTAPRSPWQNPFCERLIGSVRQDCLNHVIILGESHLRRILARYFRYYHKYRTHLSLAKDAPESRAIQEAELGKVIEIAGREVDLTIPRNGQIMVSAYRKAGFPFGKWTGSELIDNQRDAARIHPEHLAGYENEQ